MDRWDILIRFAITFVLAIIYGINRQKAHKPIGFGTFVFVSMGACGLALAAIRLNVENPLPLLSGIVTGIGFLGAGAMIKTTDKIFGFTTAASIWVFSIFGLLVGVGEYLVAGSIYLSVWIVIIVDNYFEVRGIGSYQRKLVIKTKKIVPEKDIKSILLKYTRKHKLISVEIDKGNNLMARVYLIESRREELNKIPDVLYNLEWVDCCKIE